MSYSDEFIERLEDARLALKKLIFAAEPGEHTLVFHKAYDRIVRDLALNAQDDPTASTHLASHPEWIRAAKTARPETDDSFADERARWNWWRALDHQQRQRHVFQALGDRRLSISEIAERIEHADPDNRRVHYSYAARTVKKMLEAGELRRERVERRRVNGDRLVFLYFRAPMSPEVEDLQRRLTG